MNAVMIGFGWPLFFFFFLPSLPSYFSVMGSFEGMYEQTYIYQNIVGNSKYRLEVENVSMSGIGEGQRCALLSLGCRTPREM